MNSCFALCGCSVLNEQKSRFFCTDLPYKSKVNIQCKKNSEESSHHLDLDRTQEGMRGAFFFPSHIETVKTKQ